MFNDHETCYRAFEMGDARFDGHVYAGIMTTGIYCRPICATRTPRRKNVEFFASAAAAQKAGYHPCLRCRPELSPAPGAHAGLPGVVARAFALIAEGALDSDGLSSLARRLAVSERWLRRLCIEHLGAPPHEIAQTRRVLFAKQLLHDTCLSMADVAMASGFGSIRRFNSTFQSLFSKPPHMLRREWVNGVERGEGNWIKIHLGFRPPLDWNYFLDFHRARAISGVECVDGACYRRVIRIDDQIGVVAIELGDGNHLRATIRFPLVTALPNIVQRLRNAFDLDADPMMIREHLIADPTLQHHVRARPGLRVAGNWDSFELAVRAVLGQQISVAAARKLAGRLVERWGDSSGIEDEPELRFAFPTPAQLADVDVTSLGMPGRRGAAISRLAQAVLTNPDFLKRDSTLEEGLSRLKALPGFGDWTSHYVAMRAMREPDAFPASDIGLLRSLEDEDGHRPTPDELTARSEPWRPWRAYAAQYLWAHSENLVGKSNSDFSVRGE